MLRNMNQSSGGDRICGTTHTGVPASAIPSGFIPPSLLENDIDAGDPSDCEYRVQILSWPVGATFRVSENGSFTFDGPDGTYSGTQRIFKNGVAQVPDTTYEFRIGQGLSSVANDLTANYSIFEQINAELSSTYQVFSITMADLIAEYAINESVSVDMVTTYDINQSISADLSAAYQVESDIVVPATSVSITLQNRSGVKATSVSGIRVAFFDQSSPDALLAPRLVAVTSSDANGTIAMNITGLTSLMAGEFGYLVVSNADGTISACGKVQVF